MNRAAPRLTALALSSLVLFASTAAHATNMDGLVVVVAGMLIGGPAAITLVVLLAIGLLAGKEPKAWHRTFGRGVTIAAPILAALFPLSMVLLDASSNLLGLALVFDAPVIILAIVTVIAARRLTARA